MGYLGDIIYDLRKQDVMKMKSMNISCLNKFDSKMKIVLEQDLILAYVNFKKIGALVLRSM